MRKLLFALLCVPALVFAKPSVVALDFGAVSIVTFAQAIYKSLLNRDYVISPDVLVQDRKFTVSVKSINTDDVPAFVENLLAQQGIISTKRGEIYYLEARKPQSEMYDGETKKDSSAPTFAQVLDQTVDGRIKTLPEDAKLDSMAEPQVFVPQNRPADFIASVLSATFGPHVANLAGARVVVAGNKDAISRVLKLAEAIDVLPQKVNVSATFVEVSSNASDSSGVSVIASVLGARLGIKIGDTSNGSLSLGNSNFQIVVDALKSDGRFRQIANPRGLVDEYDKHSIVVGDETPTVAGSTLDKSGNNIQQTVYRQSGVILDVLPKVLGSGKINMSIDGQVSSFQSTTTGVNGSPTLIKRQVKTAITVDDGEVVIIGGLNDNKTVTRNAGLAFLPASWSASSGSNVQTDLVLILSAKLVR